MQNFFQEISSIIFTIIAIMLGCIVLSYLIYLYDESLAIYFVKYVFPIAFIVLFVSIVKDKFHE